MIVMQGFVKRFKTGNNRSEKMCAQDEEMEDVETLIGLIGNDDMTIRQRARRALVEIGAPAIGHLGRALKGFSTKEIRWEAVMALGTINHPEVIKHLVMELEDIFPDTAWAAAEGLKKFKRLAWPILLKMLVERGENSPLLRQGVYHVLTNQKDPEFDELLQALLKDLETSTAPDLKLSAAGDILKKMKLQN